MTARLASNWGQWVKLPGLVQLWPVAIISCALVIFWVDFTDFTRWRSTLT